MTSMLAVIALGAWHGINPGMGWLFAVALGLQEGRARAVWRALPPLALGHAMAVAAVVMVALMLRTVVSPWTLKLVVAGSLFALGASRLVRARHPRYGGMRVSPLDLTVWSALMASAHGAGLMVVPFVTGVPSAHAHAAHGVEMSVMPSAWEPVVEVAALHTASYLLVSTGVAFAVYGWFGVRLLRTRWVNLDLIWAAALIVTAVVSVVY
jgi:hypothetical protein